MSLSTIVVQPPKRFLLDNRESKMNLKEREFTDWLIPNIRNIEKAGYNFMGAVVGDPGVGKSALILRIGELVDPSFTDKRMYFSLEEFLDDMDNLEKGAVIGFDEAAVTQDAHFWRSMDAEDYKHITVMWRYMLWKCFYALPDFSFLLKSQRILCNGIFIVRRRQYCEVHGIVKDFLGGSHDRWSDSQGVKRTLRDWEMPSKHIWDPYCVRKEKNFKDRTDAIRAKIKSRRMMRELESKSENEIISMIQ